MGLSVIIPTWNEEAWLPRLLIRLSDLPVDETIVVDNSSVDNTVEIARQFGCRVLPGGRPAEARNRGAAVAQGKVLLFVDADVIPTRAALAFTAAFSQHPGTDVAQFRHIPMTSHWFVRASYRVADLWFAALRVGRIHHGLVSYLVITRECFEATGGFDEHLEPGEDVAFIRRVGTRCDVAYPRSAPVLISPRRFFTENKYLFAMKTIVWEVIRLLGLRCNPIGYRWLRHDASQAAAESDWLIARTYDE